MNTLYTTEGQSQALQAALKNTQLTLEELWHRYFALGGTAGLVEVESFLHDITGLPTLQRDLLAHAMNERLDDLAGRSRAPYTFQLREEGSATGPLAAMMTLLTGMHLAPPERLKEVARSAGETLGVDLDIFLVDDEQETLHPLWAVGGSLGPQQVDTTLAGQCFRSLRPLSHDSELWVPLLDGVERVGVLHVRTRGRGAGERVLQEQCQWLGSVIGHLVNAASLYGDGLNQVRRTRGRPVSTELIWSLLPPLTAGTDQVMLAAMMHPVYGLGGDAFDYDISESSVHVAIFDATGHDLGAGLTVATALSAYRSARHRGSGLLQQTDAIDDAVMERSSTGEDFVTGVLAHLDLHTGELRYVLAGHPPPLLIRGGRLIKRLDEAQRPLLGLGYESSQLGTEMLEAGDWLLFYTDGIPEARDHEGRFFGEDRLVDFLRRQIMAGQPLPETVRRLSRAILNHQEGELQDDATVLLMRWTPTAEMAATRPPRPRRARGTTPQA